MHIDLTITSYVILAIVLYYAVLFVMSFRRRPAPANTEDLPLFVILVPARNEELVLDATLANLTGMQYGAQYRVLVVNDASTDRTAEIADAWSIRDPRIRARHRRPEQAGKGKSDVLNYAYQSIRDWCAHGDPWLAGYPAEGIVLGIVDADGRLEQHALSAVSAYFGDPTVGTTQIGVRIANADTSTLARMQDMEFVGFSWLVQVARDHLGSSGLGGNGQFTRLTALMTLGDLPWSPGALTEDLDLGLRLVEQGWRTRFCHLTYVDQQGLEHWKPLLRQRTRWIQGHYQCWSHIWPLLRSRKTRLATRLDLILYLILVVTVVLVSVTMLCGILGAFGLITVDSSFLSAVPDGTPHRLLSLVLSLLPVMVFTWTYQRHSGRPFRWFEVPTFALIFTLYTYVWLLTTIRALARLVLRRNSWVKTPRVQDAPVAESVPA
jgi:cellulose synthase/poly-beta-1,6-N-acetylglucosamine synthase-like glycosyltransferase